MDPLTEQILRLKNQQKTFSNRLEERRSQYEEANKVASERFTGALGKSNIQPSEVFGALNTFQRAGQSILEPTSNDLANIEQMLLSAEKERYGRQPSSDTISQKDLIDLQIKAKKEGLDLVPDETGKLKVVSKQEEAPKDLNTQINSMKSPGERNNARAVKDILDVVNSAITKATGTKTGPISAGVAQFSKLGTPNKTAQLEKDLSEILRTIRKESTGVAFSEQEIKALEKEIPTILQQEGNVADSLTRLKVRMLQKLGNYGVDITGEINKSTQSTRLQSPSGKVYEFDDPNDPEIKEAIKSGFIQL